MNGSGAPSPGHGASPGTGAPGRRVRSPAWRAALASALLLALALALSLAAPGRAAAAPPGNADFRIDPSTVQRWPAQVPAGAPQGWRYPQAGWTVVHIEGAPRERGLQHGHLLAAEIAAHVHALSEYWGPAAPAAAWARNRELSRRLFLPGYPAELIEEMRAIADGASAAGARVAAPGGRRRLDLLDIVTLNAANEIDSMPDALAVTPDSRAVRAVPQPATRHSAPASLRVARAPRRPQRCNAFIANGPATADGRIVFGHITMYDLYPANFYNVWMEVAPTQGHRFVMQTTPGGIHSGMDYAINEAGLLLAETTLDQGPLVPGGVALAARIRQATQYAGSIEQAAEWLTRRDNGLCSTEWVLGDLQRNEIALLTLGAGQPVLRRGSRGEWLDGAEGFYWSDNNAKDRHVRLQASAFRDRRPAANASYAPSRRDEVWLDAYRQHRGRIDLAFARQMLTTPEIVSAYGIDAKYTDASLAARLQSWASFGPPAGALWLPTPQEAREHAAIQPLIANPWTLLVLQPPPPGPAPALADRPEPAQALAAGEPAPPPRTPRPAWQGTLLPASDADIWLSAGFAQLERIVAELPAERAIGAAAVRDAYAVELAYYRAQYEQAARAGGDRPLAEVRASLGDGQPWRVASGKGVLALAALRDLIGPPRFDAAMRRLGRERHGQPVAAAQFQAFLQQHTDIPLGPLFDYWTRQTGLPRLLPTEVRARDLGAAGWETTVTLDAAALGPALAVPVTVQTAHGATTRSARFDAASPSLRIRTAARPERVLIDPQGLTPRGNGSPFTVLNLDDELTRTLIVYGTQDEAVANHEAARRLQQALRRREHNVQPPLRADHELSEDEARSHHLLLIGRPATNAVAARMAAQWPVEFGSASFALRGQRYAHPHSAVLAAGDNPLNPRYSAVLVAGLSSLATYQAAGQFSRASLNYAPVVVLPHGGGAVELVAPPGELVRVPLID